MLVQSLYPSDQEYYPYGLSNIIDEAPVYTDQGGANYIPTTTTWRMLRDRILKTFYYTSLTLQARFPTTFQINRGQNNVNFPETIHMNQTINTINDNIVVNLTGLNASSIYNIYFSMKNNHPQFPDIMHSDYVAQLNYKTKLLEEVLNVSSIHRSWVFGTLIFRLLVASLIVMLLLI
jgi:predicted DNA-binding transcriptional regulator AlpA